VLQANNRLRKNTGPGADMIPPESLTVHEEEPKKKLQKLVNAIAPRMEDISNSPNT